MVLTIPEGILNVKLEKPKFIVKKFLWVADNRFKIINSDSLEKLFEITADGKLTVIGFGRVPMLTDPRITNEEEISYKNMHFYKDYREDHSKNLVKTTLIRKIQAYLSSYNVELVKDKTALYNELYGLNFKSAKDKKLSIDLSFTYFHWKISETLFD